MSEATAESPVLEDEDEEAPAPVIEAPPAPLSAITPAGATGRRKEAIARVRIAPGTGQWTINGRMLEEYFPNKVHQQMVNEPLRTLGLEGRYDVTARITGGGISGQAGALRLGVSRRVNEADVDNNRPTPEGCLPARDAWAEECKKHLTRRRARRRSTASANPARGRLYLIAAGGLPIPRRLFASPGYVCFTPRQARPPR